MIAPLPNVNLADNETTEQPRRSIWGRQIIGSREACSPSSPLIRAPHKHTHTHIHSARRQTLQLMLFFFFLSSFPSIPEFSAEMIHGGVIRGERCWPQWLWLHSPCSQAEVNRQWTHTLFKAVCWRGLCSRVAQGRLEGRRVRSFSPGCYRTSRGCWHSGNHVLLNPTFFCSFPLSFFQSFPVLCLSMTVCVCVVRIKIELAERDQN